MLNGRIYRVGCLPLLLALVVLGVSFTGRPGAIRSSLAPDAFDGSAASEELARLSREFPSRRPGGSADSRLAGRVAQSIRALGAAGSGGFQVTLHSFKGQTIEGERTLVNVVAQRPGSTGASPIVILAHRDAAATGARAELSGSAVLLELARVFASRETRRPIILVSTSGGSGGDAGAIQFVAHAARPIDAAIVLGDVASADARRPFVTFYSDGLGGAPQTLVATVESSISQEVGVQPGGPSLLGQFMHLAFPLASAEQGPLNAAGLPAVLVQVSGPAGPSASAGISAERLRNFGRAVLNAVDALDGGPDISPSAQAVLVLHTQLIPAWALRLLGGALLLPVLLAGVDALARVRRRRESITPRVAWTLSFAGPFLLCALLAVILARLGVFARPPAPALIRALPVDGWATALIVAMLVVFCALWLVRLRLLRRLGEYGRPTSAAVGVAVLLVGCAVAAAVWLVNPFAGLLLLPALHAWLLVLSPELRLRRALGLPVALAGLLPLLAAFVFYAHELSLGPLGLLWTGLLLLGGGQLSLFSALWLSVFLGCATAVLLVALQGTAAAAPPPQATVNYPTGVSFVSAESALRR